METHGGVLEIFPQFGVTRWLSNFFQYLAIENDENLPKSRYIHNFAQY